jgi:hypothetical protein
MDSYDDEDEMVADLPFINPPAFDDEYIESKIHRTLEAKGIRIVRNALLMQITEDEENSIDYVLFKLLDIPDEEEDEDELEGIEEKSEHDRDSRISGMNGEGESMEGDLERSQQEEQVIQKKKRKKNELEI